MVEIPEDAELKPVVIEQRNEPAYSYQIDRGSPSYERTLSVHGHYSFYMWSTVLSLSTRQLMPLVLFED
jgi:hypothetical protein